MALRLRGSGDGYIPGLGAACFTPENADYVSQEIAGQAGSFTCHIFAPTPSSLFGYAHHATLVLRESTAPTEWGSIENAYRNGYSIFGPRWPGAAFCQSIRPTASAGRQRATKPAAYPVPPGPAACPERELLLLSTTMRSALLVDWQWELKRPTRIESDKPLPGTLSHGGLHFERQGL